MQVAEHIERLPEPDAIRGEMRKLRREMSGLRTLLRVAEKAHTPQATKKRKEGRE